MNSFTEFEVEEAALEWLGGLGYTVLHGPEIAPGSDRSERGGYGDVTLERRLREALARLNPGLPAEAREEAFRRLMHPEGSDLVQRNRAMHRMIVDGVTVEHRTPDGAIRGAQARVIDFDDPGANDWLAVNQFSVTENQQTRRADVVLFVNGLPLAVVELKNAASGSATTATPRSPTAATSWSSPTRRTGASTTSSTASHDTCATPCPARRSSALPERPSSCRTPTRGPSSATTSASTTSSRPCRTAPRCRSTTRAGWSSGTSTERMGLLPPAQEHILRQQDGKDRYLLAVRLLSRAFALAVPHDQALAIRDDVAFFQAVQNVLSKRGPGDPRPNEEIDHAVRQIISRAVTPDAVVDIFAAAGLKKPDISILSDECMAEVRGMPQRNVAVELLQKLLRGEIASRRQQDVVLARSFAEMLDQTLNRYRNRAIAAAQVIEELIQMAKQMREASARGEALGLSDDELAFYDALETSDSAVEVLGDETLRAIAQALVPKVRGNVRAHMRVLVKRILRKHGYPPDKQEKATQTVLDQAEALSAAWLSTLAA
jgi:type I site-specific restriction-modification system R (restriction) subunit